MTLQRRLSRLDGFAIGVGSVIGVGVFRTSGQVLRGAGGVAGSAAVWFALGAASLLGAFVSADAARRVPEAGGPSAYVREAFGRHAAFADGWLAAAGRGAPPLPFEAATSRRTTSAPPAREF